MYDQDLDSSGGFTWDPPAPLPQQPAGNTGTPPPWITGATPQGIDWATFNGGQAKDPQGNLWKWDGSQWVQQQAAAPATTLPPAGGSDGVAAAPAAGAGSLIQPFTQPYVPAGTAAPGGGQPLGSPSDYVSTIPGAPQFPNIPKFSAPTIAEAMAEPGYDFVLKQGDQNLQNWAAARGTLNDSSTAKALIDYGQGAATTQYGNVWDRAAQTYDRNVTTQYLDPFAAQYQNWMTGTVNPTMSNFSTQTANIAHGNDVRWQDNWNSWLQNWNQFRDQRDSTFNKQLSVATA